MTIFTLIVEYDGELDVHTFSTFEAAKARMGEEIDLDTDRTGPEGPLYVGEGHGRDGSIWGAYDDEYGTTLSVFQTELQP